MKSKSLFALASLGLAGVLLNGCGSSTNGGGSATDLASALTDLSSIPDASTMVRSNGRDSYSTASRAPFQILTHNFDFRDVIGEPPIVKDISAGNFDGYFWNGLVTQINSYSNEAWNALESSTKLNLANQFWGQDTSTPGPGGHGSCNMAMSTVEALARMMDGATTMCYMKNIPNVTTGGVTVTGSGKENIFKQEADDKVVKVEVANMPAPGGRTTMDVFFTIKGSNTVTSNVYAYSMYICAAGNVQSREELEVNKGSGVITMTSEHDESGQKGYNQVTAYLTTNSNGDVVFDASKDRTALSNHSGSWGTYKGEITISGDNLITSKRYNTSSWGINKDFSLASFSGSDVNNLRFREAAYKGKSEMSGQEPHSYSGVTEYQTDHFVSVAASALSTSASFTSADVVTDTFFSSGTVPTMDTSGLNCLATPDVTVTMDFDDTAPGGVASVGAVCEGGKLNDFNYGLCHGSTVQQAMTRLWSSMGPSAN